MDSSKSVVFVMDVEGQQRRRSVSAKMWDNLPRGWSTWGRTSSTPQLAEGIQHRRRSMRDHQKVIEQIFGAPMQALAEWPGLSVFCVNLEKHFEELLNDRFIVTLRIMDKSSPMSLADIWDWCSIVFDVFDSLRVNGNDASIERASQELIRRAGIPARSISAQDKRSIILAIFAVLCWCSAALCPVLGDEQSMGADEDAALASPVAPTAQQLSLAAKNSSQLYFTTSLGRPLGKMFFSFRGPEFARDEGEPGGPGEAGSRGVPASHVNPNDDALYKSSLDYFSLYTIGKVRLKWVDMLTAHLAFDRSTRTLSLYRYPSHCAINILYQKTPSTLRSITEKLFPLNYHDGLPVEPAALYREILLSYRILFGESSKSRALLQQILTRPERTDDALDPFLLTVCTSPVCRRRTWPWINTVSELDSTLFPASVVGVDGQLLEPNTYSARDDFPIFGDALLRLQRYNLRQQPSRVRDLWRDQRDPLQWYTFWAVIWVGGATILLSVLQLGVTVTQLYYDITSA